MGKPILYDLGVALGSITLWLTPMDVTRAIGYSLSIIFAGRAYYTGLMTLQAENKNDEKEGITYEADVDFHDQLLGAQVDAQLELKTLQIENAKLQQLIPLVEVNQHLQEQLNKLMPTHPEMTDEAKQEAAKSAIDSAFTQVKEIDEEEIRKEFPETMDSTSWKAILKALQTGASKDEIVRDVLGCNDSSRDTGKAYFEYLKSKFL